MATWRKPDPRKRKLAAIHIAKKQLGLDDETYRTLLMRVAGKRSSADMDAAELRAVADELGRLVKAQAKPTYPGRPTTGALELKKIEAQLADMKLSWSYADGIARRMFGIARMQWVRKPEQLKAIIAALAVEQKKRWQNASIDALLAEMGEPPEAADVWARRLWRSPPKGWRRKPVLAQRMVDYLVWVVQGRKQAALQRLAATLAAVAAGRGK